VHAATLPPPHRLKQPLQPSPAGLDKLAASRFGLHCGRSPTEAQPLHQNR
jgi:hypothetical protein